MKAIDIEPILEKHSDNKNSLIALLEDIQAKYGYLSAEALKQVAEKTGRSLVDIYGVATFYRAFSLKPRGKHLVSVCLGTACHVRGGQAVAEAFKQKLGVEAGETTADKAFTLETVNCLGACALGPIVVVDGHYFSNVKPADVDEILKKVRNGLDKANVRGDDRNFPLEVICPSCNHSLMDEKVKIDGKPSIRVIFSFSNKHGALRLSSVYGSFNTKADCKIPENTIVHFFCPQCQGELVEISECASCGAPVVPMGVRGGGMVQICTRRGCKEHMLDLNGKK